MRGSSVIFVNVHVKGTGEPTPSPAASTWLPVRHRLLLISAHRLGIYGPSLNENTTTRFGQRMSLGDNPKGASPCVLPMIAVQIQA
jgi:hypothetical protein